MSKNADNVAVSHPRTAPPEVACPDWCLTGPHEWMPDGEHHIRWHLSGELSSSWAPYSLMLTAIDNWINGHLVPDGTLVRLELDDEVLTPAQSVQLAGDLARAQGLIDS